MPDLEKYAARHDLKICTIESLIAWRRRNERLIEPVELDVPLPTPHGPFVAHLFRSKIDGKEHMALTRGMPGPSLDGPRAAVEAPVTVRVHSECLTGDVFHSLRCDCGPQLDMALALLGTREHSILVYLRQEGRGIGLASKLRAYRLQDEGMDTVEANQALGFPADLREYGIGAQILHYLGARRMILLTNNPRRSMASRATASGARAEPIQTPPNSKNINYLRTKRDKLGHLLEDVDGSCEGRDGRE